MNARSAHRGLLTAAALALLAGAPAFAQELPGADAPAPGPTEDAATSPEQIQVELMAVQQRLVEIEQAALEDPELDTARTELEGQVEAALQEADPEFDDKVERMEELGEEIQQAQQSGDAEAMQGLVSEGQTLEQDLMATHTRVTEGEPLASQIESFRERVMAKMVEVDPEAKELMERAETLMAQLQVHQGGAPPMMR